MMLDLSVPADPGLGTIRIVDVPSFPETGETVANFGEGQVTTQDLLPLFDYSEFSVDGTIVTDQGMPSDLRMQLSINLEVQAKP